MTLHENKALFKKLIEETAHDMDIPAYIAEKDYWVAYVIKTLFPSKVKDKIVFKGGTSLAKCYRAIHRFSEDIDITLANSLL